MEYVENIGYDWRRINDEMKRQGRGRDDRTISQATRETRIDRSPSEYRTFCWSRRCDKNGPLYHPRKSLSAGVHFLWKCFLRRSVRWPPRLLALLRLYLSRSTWRFVRLQPNVAQHCVEFRAISRSLERLRRFYDYFRSIFNRENINRVGRVLVWNWFSI